MTSPPTPKPSRKAEALVKAPPTIASRRKEDVYVYYESIKREPKIRGIYECRCDESLQTKSKEFTLLVYTGMVLELELISERFTNAMGECEN
jgi:hypothetical protein